MATRFQRTLHCSASDQNSEILNVCNRFCFEPVGHSDAFRLPFLGWCAVFPFSHCSNRLIVTCGGIDTNRCTWSFATCPFLIFTSCCADFPNHVPHPSRHFPAQGRLPVLRGKHDVQVDLEFRVRAASILSHHLANIIFRRAR